MILNTPLRRITLQLRHNFLTDALTFIVLLPQNPQIIIGAALCLLNWPFSIMSRIVATSLVLVLGP